MQINVCNHKNKQPESQRVCQRLFGSLTDNAVCGNDVSTLTWHRRQFSSTCVSLTQPGYLKDFPHESCLEMAPHNMHTLKKFLWAKQCFNLLTAF